MTGRSRSCRHSSSQTVSRLSDGYAGGLPAQTRQVRSDGTLDHQGHAEHHDAAAETAERSSQSSGMPNHRAGNDSRGQ